MRTSKASSIDLGIVGAASYEILVRADQEVKDKKYEGLIIRVDSWGTLSATRKMVKLILNAEYPVIAWVGHQVHMQPVQLVL